MDLDWNRIPVQAKIVAETHLHASTESIEVRSNPTKSPKLLKVCCVIPQLLAAMLLSLIVCPTSTAAQSSNDPVDAIEFDSISGEEIVVSKDSPGNHKLTVLCFLGTECPLAKLYTNRLIKLSNNNNKIRFVGLFSNVQDSTEDIQSFATDNKLQFEFGKDINNEIADRLNVERTPEVIVLDNELVIRYRGRVDNQYLPGISRNKATSHELENAIRELFAGQPVTVPVTQPEGCLLGRVRQPIDSADSGANETSDQQVTFANQVSRVLQRNCVECHRSGEIGPFALTDYDEVVGWADMMLEVIDDGRMPPWHATNEHAKFSNARLMSAADKQLLHQWVEQGTPLGDIKNLLKMEIASTPTMQWHLPREPDQIVAMRERPFSIPADGTVDYQYFVVDPKIEKDCWVSAAEIIPGNRSVVHHSIVFVRPPDGVGMKGIGWLAAFVPGQSQMKFEPNRARRIPAGSKLVFQQHYTPNGTAQTDITKIGLVFAEDDDIEFELITDVAINQEFEIKPEVNSHIVSASIRNLPATGTLLSVSPHMHYRGKSFKSYLTVEGDRDTMLHVPAYDFNWQHRYELATPVSLEEIDSISIDVEFDNSKDNPFNPDPLQYVTWGDQTWEEMAIGFFDISIPKNLSNQRRDLLDRDVAEPELTEVQKQKVESFVNSFFERFDADGNDIIIRPELPRSTRTWGFRQLDLDSNGKVTRDEIREGATRRMR